MPLTDQSPPGDGKAVNRLLIVAISELRARGKNLVRSPSCSRDRCGCLVSATLVTIG
jgi:hypothetical protein